MRLISHACRLLRQTLHTRLIRFCLSNRCSVLFSKLICMLEIGVTRKFKFEIFNCTLVLLGVNELQNRAPAGVTLSVTLLITSRMCFQPLWI